MRKLLMQNNNPSTLYPWDEELAKRPDMTLYEGELPAPAPKRDGTITFVLGLKKSFLLSCIAKRGDIHPKEVEEALEIYKRQLRKGSAPTVVELADHVQAQADEDQAFEEIAENAASPIPTELPAHLQSDKPRRGRPKVN